MASGLGNRAHLATSVTCSSSAEVRDLKQGVCWGGFGACFSNVVYVVVTYNL